MRPILLLAAVALLLAGLGSQPAHATVINVDTFGDVVADDGVCSLREAVANANVDVPNYVDCNEGDGADTIELKTGTYEIDGQLILMDSVTIVGEGMDETVIDAVGLSRVFQTSAGDEFEFRDFTITGGSEVFGGGIYHASGKLALVDLRMAGNTATNTNTNGGGGIYSKSTLTVLGSVFEDNDGGLTGGAIYSEPGATLEVDDSTFEGNLASFRGGGVYFEGTELDVADSIFIANRVTDVGAGQFGMGVHIEQGTALIHDSLFDGGMLPGAGNGQIATQPSSDEDVDLTIRDVVVRNNQGSGIVISGFTTGVQTVLIEDTTVWGNSTSTEFGAAGLVVQSGFQATVRNSTFSGNSASYGIVVARHEETTLNLTNVTIVAEGMPFAPFRGVVLVDEGAAVTLTNTVVLSGNAQACAEAEFGGGTFLGVSNADDDDTCPDSITVTPTALETLFFPGTPLGPYRPLPINSPLVDAADIGLCPAQDQIGTDRPQGAGCDIGAIEYKLPENLDFQAYLSGAAKN